MDLLIQSFCPSPLSHHSWATGPSLPPPPSYSYKPPSHSDCPADAAPWPFKVASNSHLCFRSSLAWILENFTANLWIWFLRNYLLIEDHLTECHFLHFECVVLTSLKMLSDSNKSLNFQNPEPLLFSKI